MLGKSGGIRAHRLIVALGVVTLLVVGTLYFKPWKSPTTSDASVVVAHWGSERILIYAPLYVALDGGFFAKEGLDVTISYSGNDDQVFATVASGAAQFGVGDPAFTAISRERGGRGKIVAALVTAVTNWGVTKEPTIPDIVEPSLLQGLRVTSFPPPSTTFTILSELKKTNNLDSFKIVPTPFGGELAALENGAADIGILLEPQTSLAQKQGYRVVWALARQYGPFLLTGVSTTDTTIQNRPEMVQKFVNGLQSAIELIRADPEKAIGILQASFPNVSSDVMRDSVLRLLSDGAIPNSAVVDENAWRKVLEPRVAVGDLMSLEGASAALDNSFAETASTDGDDDD